MGASGQKESCAINLDNEYVFLLKIEKQVKIKNQKETLLLYPLKTNLLNIISLTLFKCVWYMTCICFTLINSICCMYFFIHKMGFTFFLIFKTWAFCDELGIDVCAWFIIPGWKFQYSNTTRKWSLMETFIRTLPEGHFQNSIGKLQTYFIK